MPVKDVVDPSKVKCSGPGLGPTVRARVPQTFTVDCSAAGLAPLEVTLLGPSGTWGRRLLGMGGMEGGGLPWVICAWGVLLHGVSCSMDALLHGVSSPVDPTIYRVSCSIGCLTP